jgi:probable rRNA maturation factor
VSTHYLGSWRVDVERRDGVTRLLPAAELARVAAAALDAAGAPAPASLGLILSHDAELAELNTEHMGKTGPTDVLSFPMLPRELYPDHPGKAAPADADAGGFANPAEAFALPPGTRQHLGDIIVSVERAVEQAEAGRGGQTSDVAWDARSELRLLVTHGVLHVCGWDHAEAVEEAAMRALERHLLG